MIYRHFTRKRTPRSLRIIYSLLLLSIPWLVSCSGSDKPAAKRIAENSSIEVLEQEANTILDPASEIEVLAEGFTWTEGPLWLEEERCLLFSDIPNNSIFKLDSTGKVSLYLKPSGYTSTEHREKELGSNGLTRDVDGNLVLMQQGDRRVARMTAPLRDPRPEYETLVDKYGEKRLNCPNDGMFDRDGNLYFTDPPYGVPKGMKELTFHGVYCLLKNGDLVLLDSLSRPNGITLSPEGSHLYVAVSDEEHAVWYVYDLDAPGQVKNKRIFYDITAEAKKGGEEAGLPDGMKMNRNNYLFATGPGGVWIFNPEGHPIARIHTGQTTSNCALSSDEKVLYMTANTFILKVNLK